jgi:hypothetical protein
VNAHHPVEAEGLRMVEGIASRMTVVEGDITRHRGNTRSASW